MPAAPRRPKTFRLYAIPFQSASDLLSADWRPERGDLSPMELRRIARLRLAETAFVGGGAGQAFLVQRAA